MNCSALFGRISAVPSLDPQVRRELRHDLCAREPSVVPPRPPPKLTAKQLAVKMFSRAPPPIVPSMVFDEEEETPNSGMLLLHIIAAAVFSIVMPAVGTWLTITKNTPQFITTCVPGKLEPLSLCTQLLQAPPSSPPLTLH
jgi:hypothetical protein